MAELRLEHVSKSFSPTIHALDDVTLTVQAGECLAIVGPSGCGKTTLLRVIAGLEQETAGNIHIGGQAVNRLACHLRDVAMLFQRPALIPDKTVRQNLDWPRSLRQPWAGVRRLFTRNDQARNAPLRRIAEKLGLEQDLDRPVRQLSGGQQQRVALGRCLLRPAKLYLLDEPLGHLDAPLRTELRRQIRLLAEENSGTMLFVTHDPAEALAVGDRVAVMLSGRIVQLAEPAELRRVPAHRFVAELIHHGQGGMNFLPGQLGADGWFAGPLGRWRVPKSHDVQVIFLPDFKKMLSNKEFIHIIIGIAAHKVICSSEAGVSDDDVQVRLCVVRQEDTASATWVIGRDRHGQELTGRARGQERFQTGQEVTMSFSIRQTYGFDGATGQTLWAPAG